MSTALIPQTLSNRQINRIARKQAQQDLLRLALGNPLIVGLACLAGNELLYRAGLYDPAPGEKPESILGGPVWIQIGESLPPAQAKRNLINGFIIGVTTAQAMAPAMPAILNAGSTIGKALAAAA